MSKAKEQLAATLVNHWFVIDNMLALGRKKRHPTSPRYKQISAMNFEDAAAVNELVKSFSSFNSKHFIENTKFAIDKQFQDREELKVTWAPKILIRGLSGQLVAESVDYTLASSIMAALPFSRQNPEITSALELSGSISPLDHGTALSFLIPGLKNSPYCNLAREDGDFKKIFSAKCLVIQAILHVARNIADEAKADVIAGRANICITTEVRDQKISATSFSVEETDSARAQRLARERLEEMRRRRTMAINSVTEAQVDGGPQSTTQITYDLSPTMAPDEHQQISIRVQTLIGW